MDLHDSTQSEAAPFNLFEAYRGAVLDPGNAVRNFESDVPYASWTRLGLSLGIAVIVSFIVQAVRDYGTGGATSVGLDLVAAVIAIPLGFIIGSLILYGFAALFGGRGRTGVFSTDLMIHSFLPSLVFTPLSVVQDVLSLIPGIGTLVVGVLGLYQLFLLRQMIQVSRLLSPTRATSYVVWLFIISLLLGVVLAILLLTLVIGPAVNNIFSSVGSGLK